MQKGSYDAEKKTVTLQSELVGNASKVLIRILLLGYFEFFIDVRMVTFDLVV
jgi:hypothetical protein